MTNTDKKKKRKRYRWIIPVLLVAAIVLTLWQMLYVSVPLKISPETTLLTEPLNGKGGIDYEKYLNAPHPPETKTDKNGFRLLLEKGNFSQIFSDSQFTRQTYIRHQQSLYHETESFKKQLADQLGLDPKNIRTSEGITAISFNDYLSKIYSVLPDVNKNVNGEAGKSSHQDRMALIQTWRKDANNTLQTGIKRSSELSQHIDEWLKLNEPLFDLYAKAMRSDYYIQPVILLSQFEYKNIEGILNMIACRCDSRIRTGDIDGALDDLTTIARWRSFMYQQYLQEPQYWDSSFHRVLMKLNIAANPDSPPTKEQWERYRRETILPLMYDADKMWRVQRIRQLNKAQNLADGTISIKPFGQDLTHFLSLGFDWNIVAERILSETPLEDEDIRQYIMYLSSGGSLPGYFPFIVTRREWQFFSRHQRSLLLGELLRPYKITLYRQMADNVDNIRKVLYAMEMYRLEHGTYPPALTRNDQGQVLHSWRVLLLPWLGQKELFDKIKLDEPWNSEDNRQFHSVNIDVYRRTDEEVNMNLFNVPSVRPMKQGETVWSVIIGDETLFDESGKGKKLEEIMKRNTVHSPSSLPLLVARAEPVCWMKPDEEVTFTAARKGANYLLESRTFELRGIGYRDRPYAPVGFVGGTVLKLSETIRAPELLDAILTGQPVEEKDRTLFLSLFQ